MRKTMLLITLAVTLLPLIISAQERKQFIGIEGGPSLNQLWGSHLIPQNYDAGIGFSVGFSYQYYFNKNLSLHTGIGFEKKGSKSTKTATDQLGNPIGEFDNLLNYNYVVVPILGKFTFGRKAKFFVDAGPYFGKLIKVTSVTVESGFTPKTKLDLTDETKTGDFGISTGLGIEFPFGENLFLKLEVRNNLGLSDTKKNQTLDNGTIKTNSTNLLVGVCYRLNIME